ncbi:hypothetical protein LSH36_773g00013, partial [Paralvinella palmiformis]
RECLYTM